MSGEYNRASFDTPTNGTTLHSANGSTSSPSSPVTTKARIPSIDAPTGSAAGPPKAVEDVMFSDIGVSTLLNRLKQSIASARDFAAFLKKRSSLEEEQANGLKRLAKAQLDTIRRADAKQGSYAQSLVEVMKVQERMGDNGMQFALSLHQMHEDLNDLSNNMERGRKQWKHEGLDAEKRASDAEALMQKVKARYDSLAEQYDRARTGDTKGSRRMGLKGPKSAEQHEQDTFGKLQSADTEYEEKVKQAKSQRERLLNVDRPKAVKALQELIKESDSALALQLQKFATFNEKLLLGNGLAVSPLTDKESPNAQRSLRDVIYDIDNEQDFHSYIGSHKGKIPPRQSEIKYEQHPTLAPKQQQPRQASGGFSGPPQSAGGQAASHVQQPSLSVNTSGSQPASTSSRYSSTPQTSGPYAQQRPPQPQQDSFPPPMPGNFNKQGPPPPSHDHTMSSPYSAQQPRQPSPYNPQPAPIRDPYAPTPPYPTHPNERKVSDPRSAGGYTPQQTTGTIGPNRQMTGQLPSGNPMSPTPQHLPPIKPVFGISLTELFDRDQSAVPMVVYQCMQAVDLYGLEVEGIYRLSGTSSHVNLLRDQFNHNSSQIDFRNPANFYHDVNSVATLLKQFFRDLPDPLFTRQQYNAFIDAARVEDESGRRDALHQCINDLPDPNYATLRALVLHLSRVMGNEGRNRMGSGNLAICFA